MKSTVGVITNIREDHLEEMGGTLKDIAISLSHTVPFGGTLILGEKDKHLKDVVIDVAEKRHTKVIDIDNIEVGDEVINQFPYFQHKDNVAIGYAFADLFGIDRELALKGMLEAKPDVGAFKVTELNFEGKKIHWANLFAVNDRESFVETVHLVQQISNLEKLKTVVILNNRLDRAYRVEQFAKICAREIKCDYVITFGDYESEVEKTIQSLNSDVKVVKMGNSSDFAKLEGKDILENLAQSVDYQEFLLIGAVNIHTPQADAMLGFIKDTPEINFPEK